MPDQEHPLSRLASLAIMTATLAVLFLILGRLGPGGAPLNALAGGRAGPAQGGTAPASDASRLSEDILALRESSSQLLGSVPARPPPAADDFRYSAPGPALPPRPGTGGAGGRAMMPPVERFPRRPSPWGSPPAFQAEASGPHEGRGGPPEGLAGADGRPASPHYVVEPGDTLPSIAEKLLGNRQLGGRIMQANPELRASRGVLREGMRLTVPGRP